MRAEKNEKTTVMIPPPLKRRLEEYVKETGLSMAEIIRRSIEHELDAADRRKGVSRLSIR